jgi:H+/Cl- antiporter ClcA
VRLRHDRDSPHDLDDVLADLDDADKVRVHHVPWILRAAVLGIVSLTAGASLGPEAPLLALVSGFGARMAVLMRTGADDAVRLSVSGALSGMFGGPLGAAVLPLESRSGARVLPRMIGPSIVAALVGLETALLLLHGDGIPRYELPSWSSPPAAVIGWAALGAVLAAAATVGMAVSIAPLRRVAERLPTIPRAGLGGFVIGVCGLFAPLALFSGEHEAHELVARIGEWTVPALLGLLVAKIVATLASLATGFFGGPIFPAAFVGMTAGLVVATLLPGAPPGVLFAAGAGAGTTILIRRPLAATLILLLFFPLGALLPLLVGAGVGAAVVAMARERLPEPGHH